MVFYPRDAWGFLRHGLDQGRQVVSFRECEERQILGAEEVMTDMERTPTKWEKFRSFAKYHPIIPYGFWAKWGHWGHASVFIALDHWFRGGKIRLGRW